jgi:hypothetical protein
MLLDVFERDQPALPVVALEFGLGLGAVPDFDQARGQIDGVVDAAVHAHAAERVVEPPILLNFPRKIGQNCSRCCNFIACLYPHWFEISGKEWRDVGQQT